jgi:hypothetical protein
MDSAPVQPSATDDFARTAITRLHAWLTGAVPEAIDLRTVCWLVLSLAFSAYYANQGLHQAFRSPFVVQDDARQHVFWMQRFLDPQLFPHDLIADYFQTVAPSGYSLFYNLMAHLGLEPLLLNKLLPMLLGFITTLYSFGVCLRILPVPGAAFLGTLILNQSLWMQDDLVSATPRAFVYPLFLAFLYYLLKDARLACLVVIALQGLVYPSIMFVTAGVLVLRLVSIETKRLRFSRSRRDYLFCAAGLGVVLCVGLLYAYKLRDIGPVISAADARTLPEYLPGGRTGFFGYDFWRFWVTRKTSGLLPDPLLSSVPLYGALLLPLLMYYRRVFPLAQKFTKAINVLPRIIAASLFMFAVAFVVLFKLYFPNRYTQYTLRIVLALAAGFAIAIILDALLDWASRRHPRAFARQTIAGILTATVVAMLVIYPRFVAGFPNTKYRTGHASEVYEFFSRQPKDALVASLSEEAKNIPTFAKRPILVAREFAFAYHMRYYAQIQERATDLIVAHYSPDLSVVQSFIRKYGIAFVLVEREAFKAKFLARDSWLQQYQPATGEALEQLKRDTTPALARAMSACSVFENEDFVVLSAERILNMTGD